MNKFQAATLEEKNAKCYNINIIRARIEWRVCNGITLRLRIGTHSQAVCGIPDLLLRSI